MQRKTKRFTQVKRIIGQRDARLKKNQNKGEIEAKKKARGDEVIREVYAHKQELSVDLADILLQSASLLSPVLPIQYRSCPSLLCPCRYKFSFPHGSAQTGAPSDHDGLSICEMHTYNHGLLHGRAREARAEISHCLENCSG